MTRINLIKVEELSDQHLVAEYRELPRVVKQKVNTTNAPVRYKLGTGHVKWAKQYELFLINRFNQLVNEMHYRGFHTSFDSLVNINNNNDYNVNDIDLNISKQRLIEKYKMKPDWCK